MGVWKEISSPNTIKPTNTKKLNMFLILNFDVEIKISHYQILKVNKYNLINLRVKYVFGLLTFSES